MEEQQFRNKIQWFSFGFSILVIWMHSQNAELFLGEQETAGWVAQLEYWIGEGLGQIAVPGFFMISSYLFFRSFRWRKLSEKWNSRIRSVIVPYLIWNMIYYMGYVIGSRLPAVSMVMGKDVIPFNLPMLLDATVNYTYNSVFWYLQQLIFLIALAPLIYLLERNIWTSVLYLGTLTWALYMGKAPVPGLNLDALWYYSLGAFAALHARKAAEQAWNHRRAVTGACLMAGALVCQWKLLVAPHVMYILLFRLLMPFGLWLLIPEKPLAQSNPWMNFNFFLYAAHFAFVRIINKTGALLFKDSPVAAVILFLFMPFLILSLVYPMGYWLRRHIRPVWKLLNGGR